MAFSGLATGFTCFSYIFIRQSGGPQIPLGLRFLHYVDLLFNWNRCFVVEVSMKNRLRELRAAKEWSQSDLADKLDVSRQTVNAIETEKYDPSLPLAFKVARLFKSKIEDIFESDKD